MKKKLALAILIVLLLAISAGLGWFLVFKPRMAAILIETLPASQVFIDEEQVGKTPYEAELDAGEVTIKLVPDSFEKPLVPYETKITLAAGVKTIVRREFGTEEEQSAGEEISFEKVGGKIASVSVVSVPDASQVYLDGQFRDITPLKINEVTAGQHKIVVKAEGYAERPFDIQAVAGYGLTAIVDLRRNFELEEKDEEIAMEEQNEEVSDFVEILETPTGFLRVRQEPSTGSDEVGRVDPGKKYELLEGAEGDDWFKIKFGESEGWISSEYASPSASEEER